MISTHDQGQAPRKGGWVTANYGKGHRTYFAYALNRQLPYSVPGAYVYSRTSLSEQINKAGAISRAGLVTSDFELRTYCPKV